MAQPLRGCLPTNNRSKKRAVNHDPGMYPKRGRTQHVRHLCKNKIYKPWRLFNFAYIFFSRLYYLEWVSCRRSSFTVYGLESLIVRLMYSFERTERERDVRLSPAEHDPNSEQDPFLVQVNYDYPEAPPQARSVPPFPSFILLFRMGARNEQHAKNH